MTKTQLRLLRSVYRKPKTLKDCAALYHLDFDSFYGSKFYFQIFNAQMMDMVIISKSDNFEESTITIQTPGIELVEEIRQNSRRWSIPVIISLIALIGAYRQELYATVQALASLLR